MESTSQQQAKAQLRPINSLPSLAFDHDEIMTDAIAHYNNFVGNALDLSNENLDLENLKQQSFEGFLTVGDLMTNPHQIPKEQGVYVLILPKNAQPTFLTNGTGGFFKDKNPNVDISELEANWIDDTNILYIGKAGGTTNATLQSRLMQYLKFGMGKKVGHWGGEVCLAIGKLS